MDRRPMDETVPPPWTLDALVADPPVVAAQQGGAFRRQLWRLYSPGKAPSPRSSMSLDQ